MITLPINLTLTDWADQVCLDLGQYGTIGKIQNDEWKDWGANLINSTSLGSLVPNPYAFGDWQVWGQRLCESVR